MMKRNQHSFFYKAALQSVFPPLELGTFMAMSKKDKERQLTELNLIVTGIRLFNKECGKGGEGIDDCNLFSFQFQSRSCVPNYLNFIYCHYSACDFEPSNPSNYRRNR